MYIVFVVFNVILILTNQMLVIIKKTFPLQRFSGKTSPQAGSKMTRTSLAVAKVGVLVRRFSSKLSQKSAGASLLHSYETVAKSTHCDSYGHVNNAHYLTLFEEARWDLITTRGYGIDTIESSGLGPVILEANVKYLREVREGQQLRICTELDHYDGKVGQLSQTMTALDEAKKELGTASSATFLFGLFDLKKRRLVMPTPDFLRGIGGS
jgi:acyl-CoA thioester hydrolase